MVCLTKCKINIKPVKHCSSYLTVQQWYTLQGKILGTCQLAKCKFKSCKLKHHSNFKAVKHYNSKTVQQLHMDGCSVKCCFTCKLQSITNTRDTKFLYTDTLCGVSFNKEIRMLSRTLIKTLRWWENRTYLLLLYVCDIREFGYVCNIREFWCVVTLIRKEKGHIVSGRYVTTWGLVWERRD